MKIEYVCPRCQYRFTSERDAATEGVVCPACMNVIKKAPETQPTLEAQRNTVKCPKCESILQVKNNGEKVKNITCPICKKSLQVLFPDDEGKTIYGGVPDDGRTILPTNQKIESSCVLVVDGKEYELVLGKNTVGRKASTSMASLQFQTADLYMSRHHAIVNVRRIADGSLRVSVKNYENKNKTLVDSHPLGKDDELVLHDGSVILMGKTQVMFKVKS